jgi:signal transduction histidine kinase
VKFKRIRQSIWPVSLFGLGLLLGIIGLSGVANIEQARHIYQQIQSFEENYRQVETILEAIRGETFRIAILRRDRLLDAVASPAVYDRQLAEHISRINELMPGLRSLQTPGDERALDRLDSALSSYLSIVAVESKSPPARETFRLDNQDLQSHRVKIVGITDEIGKLNAKNFEFRRASLDRAIDDLETELWSNLMTALFVGLCISTASVVRISQLEQESAQFQRATEQAKEQLRHLSQQLVSSQEQERKMLSRELHDEIGQSLTALRIELGNLQRSRTAPGDEFDLHLEETKKLAEHTMRSARSISMGLRPSMLDELGLGPALQWQVREFSRRFKMTVRLELHSDLDDLPDQHRTYLYRIVQEGLTNCARHSQAKNIRVVVEDTGDEITVMVADDGVGFRVEERSGTGLGLLGISERVRELAGRLEIESAPGRGTKLHIALPRTPVSADSGASNIISNDA